MDNYLIVSKDLQETVATHPNIKEIYYDASGNHYFMKYPYVSDDKTKKELNGDYAVILEQHVQSRKDGKIYLLRSPVRNTKIVKTISREDILKAKATTLSLSGTSGLTPEEIEAVNKIRNRKN